MAPTLPKDNAYDNEEDQARALSGPELLAWEWNFSHNVPQLRKFDWKDELTKASKLLRYDTIGGVEVLFNHYQEYFETDWEVPYVGVEPTTYINEVWMGFYPSKIDYRGTVFQSMAMSNITLKAYIIESSPGRFRLDPEIAKYWDLVERRLDSITSTLRPFIPFPQTVRAPRNPSMHGYTAEHPTKLQALEAARKSRNAFPFLQAYLSFLVSFWHNPNSRPLDSVASWLARRLCIDPFWMTSLITLHPIAYNDRVTRLGMTMNHASPWLRFLPLFVDCNVRVGLYTAKMEFELAKSEYAFLYTNGRPLCYKDDDCVDCLKSRVCAHPLDAPDPNKFINEREEEWLDYRKTFKGTKEELEHYVSRIKADLSTGEELHDRGWKAFEWFKVGGLLRRMAVPRSHMNDVVDAYPRWQRYCSSLDKEVDLCAEFRPLCTPTSPPPSPSHAPAPYQAALSAPSPVVDDSEEGEYSGDEHTANVSTAPSTAVAPPAPRRPKWKVIAYLRLGLEWDDALDPPSFGVEHSVSAFDGDRGPWRAIQSLGLRFDVRKGSITTRDALWLVFACRTLCRKDLSIRNISSPFDIATRKVIVLLGQFQIEQVQNVNDRGEIVRRFAIGVKDKPMKDQWFVVVVDALALLEAGRRGCTGILALCRGLACEGIQFFTARYYPSSTVPTMRSTARHGLGMLTTNTISSEGYRLYQAQRDAFLSGPRGGLALRAGGCLARLAMNIVDYKKAATPPSQDAKHHGRYLGRTREGYAVISDYLEPQEVDRIQGRFVYLRRDKMQISISIWPSMAAWDCAGLNTGAWNEEAEQWYENLCGTYENSQHFVALNSSTWRNDLKRLSKAREMWKRYRAVATEYLAREYQ